MQSGFLPMCMVTLLASAIGAGCARAAAGSVDGGDGFTDHGIAAPVARARGVAATLDGAGRPVVLAWLEDVRGCYQMLAIDAATGAATDHPLPFDPRGDAPGGIVFSSRGRFYALFGHHFVEFDAATHSFTFVGDADDRLAISMTEAPDGTIWAATYPRSHLFSFNPDTRVLVEYGSINQETWPQYQPYIAVDRAGWVYVEIGATKSQLVAFNPDTREIRPFVKDEERQSGGWGEVWVGTDDQVYGRFGPTAPWHVLLEGVATPIEKPPVAPAPMNAGQQEAVFRDFPNGWRINEIDIPERRMEIRDTRSGELRHIVFDYKSEGPQVFSLILGPDGKIHGSTGHPLRFFSYDPVADAFTYPALTGQMGHLNALAVQGGRVFGGLYGGQGGLYQYDPARPWDDTAQDTPNPRRVAAAGLAVGRPHAMIAHPDGRHVIMTGTPGYGYTGGGMVIYDMETGRSEVLDHESLIPNQSTISLTALSDGSLVGGTAIWPGTGGATLAQEAELYLMDFGKRETVWRKGILPGTVSINDLVLGPDGLVYGLAAGPTFFVFDPAARKLVHQETITAYGNLAVSQAPRMMLVGPDKRIYACFSAAIVRIEPGTFQHRLLAKPPVVIVANIVLCKGRLYFSHGSRLWSWRVPGLN